MIFRILQLISALVTSALVSAHGFVQQVTIDGIVYQGNNLNVATPAPSIIRLDAQFASLSGNVNPGSQVQCLWVGGTDGSSNWSHDTGPLIHYMAMCEGSCSTYNSTNAEWFKISELGLEADGITWYQAALDSRAPVNVTIPSTIAPGEYLLRSEIISLQNAVTEGGAEFYPCCVQLNVGGDQTQGPTSSEVCTFPGCYSDTDPGILTPNIDNPPIQYIFPGPPVASFANTNPSSSVPSLTPTAPSSIPTESVSSSSGAHLSTTLSRTSAGGVYNTILFFTFFISNFL
ncbi:hypothetical protein AZE42_09696 [Rhizopogon vesiculosus]|uniref:lytic cellulose monooxygenase (C4-dehydrogenating) n=1 Tax=Rhizopogon vesiculosus TaxID=180088 RepID=A0A1J8PMJ9_9AGAM|nr:hypothetical protein AZE42_09696 [Rhizopogon vesiculosus]